MVPVKNDKPRLSYVILLPFVLGLTIFVEYWLTEWMPEAPKHSYYSDCTLVSPTMESGEPIEPSIRHSNTGVSLDHRHERGLRRFLPHNVIVGSQCQSVAFGLACM
jgi:hypothetical protein